MDYPIKIILISDNHGNISSIDTIRQIENDAQYYFHCGDACIPKQLLPDFIVVEGNNDPYQEYPLERIVGVGPYRILLTHGHRYLSFFSFKTLVKKAKDSDCQIVCFGHTHMYYANQHEGIYLFNPGSCVRNRDGSEASYMRIWIQEDGSIETERMTVPSLEMKK